MPDRERRAGAPPDVPAVEQPRVRMVWNAAGSNPASANRRTFMTQVSLKRALLAAAALTLIPAAAAAQEDVKERAEKLSDQANEMQEQAQELANDATVEAVDRDGRAAGPVTVADGAEPDDDDDSGNWGLLGLLGLAGLLGLKRRDTHHLHTDNRRI
ncbi:hypothetical protein E2493_20845 [Sphingomonas parva]|uniref:MYXO-CTERM domain-containing protein n=1 Tax=Sphingomonas parva TaxID=2555898 RepID=A0A4Y8ZND0_9SPHN|nr:WGxxGxxG family protein [Sphingomonas parva]TFI56309.1 hypothetical protein E2493_20845 [Sphingomonas parva]